MKIQINKNKTCCFIGHRPDKIDMTEEKIRELLKKEIKSIVDLGFENFITGMSKGFDLWAAKEVLRIKEEFPKIKLICAMPYDGFESYYDDTEKELYNKIIKASDEVYFVCRHYSRYCFQIRNTWMVDNSNCVITLFTGKKGGTKNTLEYAKKKRVQVVNLIKKNQ